MNNYDTATTSNVHQRDNLAVSMDAEIYINQPPPQDSPSHILNALNDDCLEEVLQRVQNIEDFFSAFKVCARFQENAKKCFPERFTKISVYRNHWSMTNRLPMQQLFSFLSVFGHKVQSISLNYVSPGQDIIDKIADFCGKTLKTLKINEISYSILPEIPSSFQALEHLELSRVRLCNFNLLSTLKTLRLDDVNRSDIRYISKHLLNLEHLTMNIPYIRPTLNLMVLRSLRQLKRLHVNCPRYSIRALLNSFAEDEVPLEDVLISAKSNFAESLVNIKSIKKLTVYAISDKNLLDIVQNLPVLQSLFCTGVTVQGIGQALKFSQNAQHFDFYLSYVEEDWADDYNIILNEVLTRDLIVHITIRGQKNMPETILTHNKEKLRIFF